MTHDDLDPGIRETVAFLLANGFHPTDSGDGKAKFTSPDPMECAEPVPNVHMVVATGECIAETERLAALLRARGIDLVPMGDDGPALQMTYDPFDGRAIISLYGLDDAGLKG